MVDFSLDAVSQEAFDIIRVGLNFTRTQNVERFIELRNEMGVGTRR